MCRCALDARAISPFDLYLYKYKPPAIATLPVENKPNKFCDLVYDYLRILYDNNYLAPLILEKYLALLNVILKLCTVDLLICFIFIL